jgi:hypothetical protein
MAKLFRKVKKWPGRRHPVVIPGMLGDFSFFSGTGKKAVRRPTFSNETYLGLSKYHARTDWRALNLSGHPPWRAKEGPDSLGWRNSLPFAEWQRNAEFFPQNLEK